MLLFDYHEIGNKLLYVRKNQGLTQAEVAEAAGLSDRTYADIERGTVNMRTETLLRICKALHITPDEVLTQTPPSDEFFEKEILEKLNSCGSKDRKTAYRIIKAFLDSIE